MCIYFLSQRHYLSLIIYLCFSILNPTKRLNSELSIRMSLEIQQRGTWKLSESFSTAYLSIWHSFFSQNPCSFFHSLAASIWHRDVCLTVFTSFCKLNWMTACLPYEFLSLVYLKIYLIGIFWTEMSQIMIEEKLRN